MKRVTISNSNIYRRQTKWTSFYLTTYHTITNKRNSLTSCLITHAFGSCQESTCYAIHVIIFYFFSSCVWDMKQSTRENTLKSQSWSQCQTKGKKTKSRVWKFIHTVRIINTKQSNHLKLKFCEYPLTFFIWNVKITNNKPWCATSVFQSSAFPIWRVTCLGHR